MGDHDPPDDGERPNVLSLSACPVCGGSITRVTVHSPSKAVSTPCGCQFPPAGLEFE
ncbi:hypothetical protein [Natrialba taiwanensis]|uniref:hypothetical protein n=1 Tax=Natrialba taiwanensis TaxID=160846 RepID=UPI000B0085AD|nr:hypothetical protein [Natrialba taiwanensis]